MEKRAGVALRLDFRKAQIIHPTHQPIRSPTFQAGLFHPDNFLGLVPFHETSLHNDTHTTIWWISLGFKLTYNS